MLLRLKRLAISWLLPDGSPKATAAVIDGRSMDDFERLLSADLLPVPTFHGGRNRG
jgi:hypothetical protein